jgi:cytochrome c
MSRLALFALAGAASLTLAACGSPAQDEAAAPTDAAANASATPVATAAMSPPVFAQCRTCHMVEAGKNGAGPSLFGVVGAKAGHVSAFPYSPALKGSGLVWDRETLDAFLAAPNKLVPGTRMVVMVPDPAQRAQLIAYLESLK